MKKFISIVLVLTLVLSLGITSFAQGETPVNEDEATVVIKKEYKLTNPGTLSPAETFNFTIERTSVTDAGVGIDANNMPIPTIGSVTYAKGEAGSANATKDITVTLPDYTSVGIYTYTINETAGNKAGVTYYAAPIKLVVTVTQGEEGLIRTAAVHTETTGEKTDTFSNEYSAGELEISEFVTGNLGDKQKYFDVIVTLTGEAGMTYDNPYEVSGGSDPSNPTTIVVGTPTTFKLKDGETIEIDNLPYCVTYTVVEADYSTEGYSAAAYVFEDTDKKIDSDEDTVQITIDKSADVDTGISLNSIPFILLLAGAVIGMGIVFFKKRENADF